MRKPLSVYIHIPFCERRCGYCDFYSTVGNGRTDIGGYVHRVCGEIRAFPNADDYIVQTVYIGGGTPSLLSDGEVFDLIKTLREKFKVDPDAEITIECNPNSLSGAKLRCYKEYGINRVSIGVQSFDDKILRRLGRVHTAARAVTAVRTAKKYFDNISIDLIVGVPDETSYEIPSEILDIITHISVYSLMKDDMVVCESAIEFALPNFIQYEVSNWTKRGCDSRHNRVYWNGGEYIGFGAAAHSLLNNRRFNNTEDLFYTRENEYERTDEQIGTERIMLGLRTADGVPMELLADKKAEIEKLEKQGLIKCGCYNKGRAACRIVATKRGWQLLNQITLLLTNQTR